MHRRFVSALLCAPVLLSSFSATASADEREPVETLIVTASRTPVPESQVGSSVTLLEEDYLAARQGPFLADMLRGIPGLAVNGGGAAGSFTQLRVRGAEANQVLVLIDGIEANDPAAGGEFNFAHLLADDIERVEIVRGPQSALWGSDALAGVVNIQTRHGETGRHGSAIAEGGSFGTWHGGGTVGGAGENYRVRLSGSILDGDGTNSSREGGEEDGYENLTLGLNADWRPASVLSLALSGRHVSGTEEHDAPDFTTGMPADADLESDFEQNYGRVAAGLALFDDRFRNTVSGTLTATDHDNRDTGVDTDGTSGEKFRLAYQGDLFFDTLVMLAAEHVLSVIAEYEDEDFHQRGTATPFGDPNQDLGAHSQALAGEYRVLIGEALAISAGARHDWNAEFGDDTGWRLTGAYSSPGTATRLRGSYGTGNKNPTFTERFGFFTEASDPFFVGNPDLRPETSSGWEIGVDQTLAAGNLRLGLTWFQQDLEDEISGFVFDPGLGVFTALNVEGRSRRRGIELTADAAPVPGLNLRAGYGWLDATQPDPVTGEQVREVRRPRHSAGVNVDWRFAADRARLNLNIDWNGDQKDAFFPPPTFAAVPVTLDGNVLAALTASWRFSPRLELFGRIQNLLDADYEEIVGYAEPGISAYAGLRLATGR